MKRSTHTRLLIAVLTSCALIGVWFYNVVNSQKQGWPRCQGIPTTIPATLTNTEWQAKLRLSATNAPCYVDITATASDGSDTQTSRPIRIYVKKR